jgi:hypothetical protein
MAAQIADEPHHFGGVFHFVVLEWRFLRCLSDDGQQLGQLDN